MTKAKIPDEIKEIADKIIADFNVRVYNKTPGVEYYPFYRGNFLYLNRK